MRAEEIDAVTGALGQTVTGVRTLAGGFSHETCLLELGADRVVARLGGTDPAIEAAVMDAAREHVPVPEVLRVVPASADGVSRPAMVLEYVDGTLLSHVLEDGSTDMNELGVAVGQAFGGIGAVAFGRPGFFTGPDLAIGDMPPWSEQLPEMAVNWMAATPDSRLDTDSRRAWIELCTIHAPSLVSIDKQARLVHADANPKNVLVSRAPGDGWRVDAVLDWEFSFSGCPYADYANMTRFGGSYPEEFVDGFRAGFASRLGDDARGDWVYLGRVMDMFALSDLVTRAEGNPVADQAATEIRRWIADGVPGLRDGVPGLHLAPDPPGQLCLAFFRDVQYPVFRRQGAELLLLVRHSRRQGRHVPVHVRVGQLAAERQGVHALGRHRFRDCPRDPVHDALEGQELRLAEAAYPVLDVSPGRDQAVADKGRVAVEERDGVVVLVDDVVTVAVGVIRHPADPALAVTPDLLYPAGVVLPVHRYLGVPGDVHPGIIASGGACG